MKELTFPVSFSMGRCGDGDFDIRYEVTDEEYAKLIEESNKWYDRGEEGDAFGDVEELSDLYNRLYEQAIDDTVESLRDDGYEDDEDLTAENGEFDDSKAREYVTDNFDFCIDYPVF